MHYLPKDNIDFPFNQNESVCHLSECKCYFGLFIQFSLLFFLEPVTLTRMIRECLRKQNTDRQKKKQFHIRHSHTLFIRCLCLTQRRYLIAILF